ncbi:MAG: hypothetical protein FD180_976 [Planctomycetota bacterium]|nr:MAG: hypothetical protein FD180_976 [Planctomycetota bacterium]
MVVPILVVLVAGCAFAAVGYFVWSGHRQETPDSAELKRLNALHSAILAYKEERGTYPPGPSSALVRALATRSKRGVPFLEIPAHALSASGELLDGWGTPVCYREGPNPPTPGGRPYELYSCGPNGKDERGAGDDVGVGD